MEGLGDTEALELLLSVENGIRKKGLEKAEGSRQRMDQSTGRMGSIGTS